MDALSSRTGVAADANKRELLGVLLKQKGIDELRSLLRPIMREKLTASFYQEYGWKLGGPVNNQLNIPYAVRLFGPIDVGTLWRALLEIVRRHESLRTTFQPTPEALLLRVTPAETTEMPMPIIDLSALPAERREELVIPFAREHANLTFDLRVGPLFVAQLAILAPDDHLLLCNMHHIISDGWSITVFQREMLALYAAFVRGLPSPLPPLPIQFSEFATWQRLLLRSKVMTEEIAWWRNWLGDQSKVMELPGDKPRPEHLGPDVGDAMVLLQGEPALTLRALGSSIGCTVPMVLTAGIVALLYRYTGREDIVLGTISSGRTRPELAGLIGFFMNTLALRTDVDGSMTFLDLVKKVRQATLSAFEHQDVPFPKLVQELAPEHATDRTALFRVVLNILSYSVPLEAEVEGGEEEFGIQFERIAVFDEIAKYDLAFTGQEGPDSLTCLISAALDVFNPESVEHIREDLEAILLQVIEEPEVPLSRILPSPRLGSAA